MTNVSLTKDDIGKACIFVDSRGKHYPALITAVHGHQCVNLIYVNDVAGQTDAYGQKLLRGSSILHARLQQAWGNYFLMPGEPTPSYPRVEDSAA